MAHESIIFIPSRLESTRLKNKPLVDLGGMSLIERVYKNATTASDTVYVATDSQLIEDNLKKITTNIITTSKNHISGTDRVCEAANSLDLNKETLIINLQGDEPFIPPTLITQIINDYFDNKCDVITASNKITDNNEIIDPNSVLVETDSINYAKKFIRTGHINNPRKHVGIYGYSLKILNELVALPPSKGEINLKLEQLRFMENGYSIYVSPYDGFIQGGIDTEEDLIRAKKFLEDENI
tara:strand:+ start:17153 stop:17872 length:720 start_codon:yes stop_codon:yes gene_type:complete